MLSLGRESQEQSGQIINKPPKVATDTWPRRSRFTHQSRSVVPPGLNPFYVSLPGPHAPGYESFAAPRLALPWFATIETV